MNWLVVELASNMVHPIEGEAPVDKKVLLHSYLKTAVSNFQTGQEFDTHILQAEDAFDELRREVTYPERVDLRADMLRAYRDIMGITEVISLTRHMPYDRNVADILYCLGNKLIFDNKPQEAIQTSKEAIVRVGDAVFDRKVVSQLYLKIGQAKLMLQEDPTEAFENAVEVVGDEIIFRIDSLIEVARISYQAGRSPCAYLKRVLDEADSIPEPVRDEEGNLVVSDSFLFFIKTNTYKEVELDQREYGLAEDAEVNAAQFKNMMREVTGGKGLTKRIRMIEASVKYERDLSRKVRSDIVLR